MHQRFKCIVLPQLSSWCLQTEIYHPVYFFCTRQSNLSVRSVVYPVRKYLSWINPFLQTLKEIRIVLRAKWAEMFSVIWIYQDGSKRAERYPQPTKKLEWTTRKERPCSLGGAEEGCSKLEALKLYLASHTVIRPLKLLANYGIQFFQWLRRLNLC